MASVLFFNIALLTPPLFLLLLLASSTSSATQLVQVQPRPGQCQRQCGDVKVVYPFGIGKGCGRSKQFQFLCKKNDRGRFKPFIKGNNNNIFGNYDLEVSSISVSGGLARIRSPVSYVCNNSTSGTFSFDYVEANLTQTPFWLSNTQNKLVVIGSDVFAYITIDIINGTKSIGYRAGCVAQRWGKETDVNGSCNGINGCCEATIPFRSKSYFMMFDLSFSNVSNLDTCGYAVFTESNRFKFSTSYLTTPGSFKKDAVDLSVVLDWAISSEKCKVAQRNITSYACVSSHSTCIDYRGLGYRCSCAHGYHGNPYILGGCQHTKDIQRSVQRKTCIYGSTMTNDARSSQHLVPKLAAGSDFDDNRPSCNKQLCEQSCLSSCSVSDDLCRKCYFDTPSCCCKK